MRNSKGKNGDMENGGHNTHSLIFPEDEAKSTETGGAEEMAAPMNGGKKPFLERGTRTTFSKMKKSRFRQKAVHVPTRNGGHELFHRG